MAKVSRVYSQVRLKRTNRRKRIIRRRNTARPARMYKSMNANKDYASIVEVVEQSAVPEGGNMISLALSQFARAKTVAANFRFYKCTKVELEFIPYANMFPGGTAFPELYFQVDRTASLVNGASLPLPTKGIMMARGCLPQKWTGVIKKSFKPSVLRNENLIVAGTAIGGVNNAVVYAAPVTSTPVFNKWYEVQQYNHGIDYATQNPGQVGPAFDPLNLQWLGAAYCIDQPLAAPAAILGTIKMKVHWLFKQPLVTSDPNPPHSNAA